MPIAEILAGISLVKASVDFIKSNLDTCKDIGEIGGAIDGLLRGKDEVDKKSNQRGLGFKEQFDYFFYQLRLYLVVVHQSHYQFHLCLYMYQYLT